MFVKKKVYLTSPLHTQKEIYTLLISSASSLESFYLFAWKFSAVSGSLA